MGQAAQTRLDAADDDGGILERLADEVAVDRDGTIGTAPLLATRGIGIGVTAVLGHRIVVDHGVHVAGADEKARRGSPSTVMLAGSVQSGWQMIPTL